MFANVGSRSIEGILNRHLYTHISHLECSVYGMRSVNIPKRVISAISDIFAVNPNRINLIAGVWRKIHLHNLTISSDQSGWRNATIWTTGSYDFVSIMSDHDTNGMVSV